MRCQHDRFCAVHALFSLEDSSTQCPAVWSFVSDYRYGWSEKQIGLSLGVFGLGGAFVMAVVLPRLVPLLGEWRTCAIGLTFTMVADFGYAAAWQGRMVYVVMVSRCLEALADPPLRSLRWQSAAFGAGRTARRDDQPVSITAIIAPLIYTKIFAAFTGPNAPVRVRWRTLCARRHFHRDFVGCVPAEGGKTGCACGRSRAGHRLEPSFRSNRNEALSPCWSRIFLRKSPSAFGVMP
jgi:hypothetical protein